MALNSFKFVIFFSLLFTLLTALELVKKRSPCKKIARIQTILLLLFSYFSIFTADWRFCLCVFVATIWTFFLAKAIQNAKNKRTYLSIGIAFLLLMLGYFKYTNFFLSSFSSLLGLSSVSLNIILPIGISFYSFTAIAYLLDVYWERYKAVNNFLDFSLYIAFFPKMLSGPIVLGKDFFPQLQNYRGIKAKAAAEGIQIFVFGLFKKIVLADRLGVFVDDVFFAPVAYNTASVILAAISYSLQIYFDFSGYSDMAIGISKMIGFDFTPNFNLPYWAGSFSDFWKRWHISLSSWFQEYLYFPLGGSRKGKWRTCINLLLVMLVSGLWHGAGVTFLLWGLLYGIISSLEHLLRKKKASNGSFGQRALKALGVYIVVMLLWIPFRASSLSNALEVLKGCFTIRSGIWQPYFWTFFALACLIFSTALAIFRSKKVRDTDKYGRMVVNAYYPVMDLTKFVPLCLFFIFCGLTILFGYFGDTAFIYGQF